MMLEEYSIVNKEEAQSLILSCCRARGKRGATEEEIVQVIAWAERVKGEYLVLEMILDGQIDVCFRNGDIEFRKRRKGKTR